MANIWEKPDDDHAYTLTDRYGGVVLALRSPVTKSHKKPQPNLHIIWTSIEDATWTDFPPTSQDDLSIPDYIFLSGGMKYSYVVEEAIPENPIHIQVFESQFNTRIINYENYFTSPSVEINLTFDEDLIDFFNINRGRPDFLYGSIDGTPPNGTCDFCRFSFRAIPNT